MDAARKAVPAADHGALADRRGAPQAGRPLPAAARPVHRPGGRTARTGRARPTSGTPNSTASSPRACWPGCPNSTAPCWRCATWTTARCRECAELIGRTVHATEALLVRARRAFRSHYPEPEGGRPMNNSHDPLTVLHGDDLPVQPDPAFAARLRARLESALSLPESNRRSRHEWHRYRHRRTERPPPSPTCADAPRPAALPYLAVGRRARGHRLVRRRVGRRRSSASRS